MDSNQYQCQLGNYIKNGLKNVSSQNVELFEQFIQSQVSINFQQKIKQSDQTTQESCQVDVQNKLEKYNILNLYCQNPNLGPMIVEQLNFLNFFQVRDCPHALKQLNDKILQATEANFRQQILKTEQIDQESIQQEIIFQTSQTISNKTVCQTPEANVLIIKSFTQIQYKLICLEVSIEQEGINENSWQILLVLKRDQQVVSEGKIAEVRQKKEQVKIQANENIIANYQIGDQLEVYCNTGTNNTLQLTQLQLKINYEYESFIETMANQSKQNKKTKKNFMNIQKVNKLLSANLSVKNILCSIIVFWFLQLLFGQFKNLNFCSKLYPQVTVYKGYEIVESFDHSNPYIHIGLLMAAIMLVAFSIFVCIKKGKKPSQFVILIILYFLSTAVFAVIRSRFDTGIILLLVALLHNSVELGLINLIGVEEKYQKKFLIGDLIFVWLLMTAILYIPDFLTTFALVQSLGQSCDIMLIMLFCCQYVNSKAQPDEHKMYLFGLIAAIAHQFQIWALILVGLHVRGAFGNFLEFLIIFLVLVFAFYYKSCQESWDSGKVKQTKPSLEIFIKLCLGALIISTIIIVTPLLIPQCSPPQPKPDPAFDGVTGVMFIQTRKENEQALLEELQQMILPVRKEWGCRSYNFFSMGNGTCVFIETWENMTAFQNHLNSTNVEKVFKQPYYSNLILNSSKFGPLYTVLPGLPEVMSLVFEFDINCSPAAIWSVMGNFSDYSYIKGAWKIEFLTPTIRKIYMEDGSQVEQQQLYLSDRDMKWKIKLLKGIMPFAFQNYTEELQLFDHQNQTRLRFLVQFQVKSEIQNQARDQQKQDFELNKIPWLKHFFSLC